MLQPKLVPLVVMVPESAIDQLPRKNLSPKNRADAALKAALGVTVAELITTTLNDITPKTS